MSAGYGFVPLPDSVHVRNRPEAVFDRRVPGALSGVVIVDWLAEQPIHVGSGFKALLENKVVRRAARVRGSPGIPGASMKGVLRARYEAITMSCIATPPKARWKVRSKTYNLDKADALLTREALGNVVFRTHENPRSLCPACALFGRMSLRSRVSVADVVWVDPARRAEVATVSKQFGPNLHHVGKFRPNVGPGRRASDPHFEVYSLYGRKFAVGPGPQGGGPAMEYVEALPRDSALRGEVRLLNVLPEELGGLLIAIGLRPSRGALKVGGGKAQGFGRVRPQSATYRLVDCSGSILQPDEDAWSDAFERWGDRFAQGVEALLAMHQGNC